MKKKILILIACMVMVVLSSVPCFAATYEEYSYNGVVLPALPDVTNYPRCAILLKDGVYYLGYTTATGKMGATDDGLISSTTSTYKVENGVWVKNMFKVNGGVPVWANFDILYPTSGEVLLRATDIQVTLVEKAVEYSDFKSAIEAFAKQITVQQVVSVLAWIASAVVALPFLWWGVRKLTRALMGAFKKGRISL